jgi:hypothetical protein
MSQVQAIVDHHHPHDGARTTISKVRFVDPKNPDANDKVPDESNEVNFKAFSYSTFVYPNDFQIGIIFPLRRLHPLSDGV